MSSWLKAVLIGDSGVGKTSIYQRLEQNIFNPAQVPTVGGSFAKILIPNGNSEEEIGLWDTAGQERFRMIVPLYFQRASIVIIVFSLGHMETFESVQSWYDFAKLHAPPDVHFFLIGNKSDLVERRAITFDDAEAMSGRLEADVYIETSALTGAGFEELLSAFGRFLRSKEAEGGVMESGPGKRQGLDLAARPRDTKQEECC
jgi:small GTP-binding protein